MHKKRFYKKITSLFMAALTIVISLATTPAVPAFAANAWEYDYYRNITIDLDSGNYNGIDSPVTWGWTVDRTGGDFVKDQLLFNVYGNKFKDRNGEMHQVKPFSNNGTPCVGTFYQHMDCVGVTPQVCLKDPVRDGYEFAGWTVEKATSYGVGDIKPLNYGGYETWVGVGACPDMGAAITIKAIWKCKMTITYDSGVASVSGAGTYNVGDSVNIGVTLKPDYELSYVKDLDSGAVYTYAGDSSALLNDWSMWMNRRVYIATKSTGGGSSPSPDPGGGEPEEEPDTTPPSITLTVSPSGWTNNKATVYVTASDSESGVNSITLYESSGGSWSSVTSSSSTSLSYTVSWDSTSRYGAKAWDNAGNESSMVTGQVFVDVTPPSIASDYLGWTNTPQTISARATDSTSGMKKIELYDENGSLKDSGISQVSYTMSKEGKHYFSFKAWDNVNNQSSLSRYTRIDYTDAMGEWWISSPGDTEYSRGGITKEFTKLDKAVYMRFTDSPENIVDMSMYGKSDSAMKNSKYGSYHPDHMSGLKTVELLIQALDGPHAGEIKSIETFNVGSSSMYQGDYMFEEMYVIEHFYNYFPDASRVQIGFELTDNAGNVCNTLTDTDCDVDGNNDSGTDNFDIEATVERYHPKDGFASTHFLAGERGIMHITVYGYVQNLDVAFDRELEDALAYQQSIMGDTFFVGLSETIFSKNFDIIPKECEDTEYWKKYYPATADNVYVGDGSTAEDINEGYEFYVPLYLEEKAYNLWVTATKNSNTRRKYMEITVGESVLRHRRTRIRLPGVDPYDNWEPLENGR